MTNGDEPWINSTEMQARALLEKASARARVDKPGPGKCCALNCCVAAYCREGQREDLGVEAGSVLVRRRRKDTQEAATHSFFRPEPATLRNPLHRKARLR